MVTPLFHEGLGSDVTAIIAMTAPVAVVLPVMISIAAIGSQFSAAVADTEGAGGLLSELTKGKVPERYGYALILLVTLALTWETDVNEIIAFASRGFALYYALQCCVAFCVAKNDRHDRGRLGRMIRFGFLALACLAVFALGIPAE